jgi:hypothetical protein
MIHVWSSSLPKGAEVDVGARSEEEACRPQRDARLLVGCLKEDVVGSWMICGTSSTSKFRFDHTNGKRGREKCFHAGSRVLSPTARMSRVANEQTTSGAEQFDQCSFCSARLIGCLFRLVC